MAEPAYWTQRAVGVGGTDELARLHCIEQLMEQSSPSEQAEIMAYLNARYGA